VKIPQLQGRVNLQEIVKTPARFAIAALARLDQGPSQGSTTGT